MKNPNSLTDKSEKARAYEIAAKIWKTLAVVIVILLLISHCLSRIAGVFRPWLKILKNMGFSPVCFFVSGISYQ